MAPRRAVVGADPHQPVDAALGLGIAIGILALEQQGRGFDARLFAGMVIDQLDLHAAALGPARIHALEHLGPVLALGATRAGVDLDIGIVGVGLTRQQRLDLVLLGAFGERGEAGDAFVDHALVTLGLGHVHELDRVVALGLDRLHRGDRLIEAAALLHDALRLLGIVPQFGILDARIELVEPAQRAIPVEETADQRQCGVDLIDMGLRFGAHLSVSGSLSCRGRCRGLARLAAGPR